MRSKYLKKQNKYSNPFFKKKKRKVVSKINWRRQLFIWEAIILIIGLIWFFCFSTVFNLVVVDTNSTKRISKHDIINIVLEQAEENRFLIASQKNIFLFDIKRLEDLLNNRYLLKDLTIKKELPNKIIINIIEKDYSAIWQEDDDYSYISETGKIINKADIADIVNYPLIHNIGKNYINDNGSESEIERISYIMKLFEKFKDKTLSKIDNDRWFVIQKFILDDMEYTVQMVIKICTNIFIEKPLLATMMSDIEEESKLNFEQKEECQNGPMIYFNLQEDIEKQVTKLLVLMNEKLKNNLGEKEYIDLRYGDKVYYK